LNLTSSDEEECAEPDIKLEKAKLNRRNELHDVISMAIVDMGYKNKQAPSNDIWNYNKNHQDRYECIQEVTDTEISWCSYRGSEQDMKRERFNNVVSEYNTGKKTYPNAA
jgi:hypothetical protein